MGERGVRDASVGELAERRVPIAGSLTCEVVDGLFRRDPALRSLLVRSSGGVVLLNRTAFYQALVGPKGFGWALYRRRPVAMLARAHASARPALASADPAVDAALEVLRDDELRSSDDLLVRWTDGTEGTVALPALLAALAAHHEAEAEAVANRERRFRALVERVTDVIVVVDEGGAVVYTSVTLLDATGDDAPRAALSLVHPDDRAAAMSLWGRCLATPEAVIGAELRLRATDRTFHVYEAQARNLLADPAVGGVVLNFRDVTVQRELEDRLRHQAFHDPLTGLPNRSLLHDRAEQCLARVRRDGRCAGFLFLDLDGFKDVNDAHGHPAGDLVLVAVARALHAEVRPGDTLARIGGDEFAVLLDGLPGPADAAAAAARLHRALELPAMLGDREVCVRASIGVAVCDDPDMAPAELMRRADFAMYTAKTLGKNRTVRWTEELEGGVLEEQQLAQDVVGAVLRGELSVAYQPIVDLTSGAITGVEALARWHHPERGDVPPDVFIPLAERSGAIGAIGAWVLETACAQAAAWQAARPEVPLRLSVNVSGSQLADAGFAGTVAAVLDETGWPGAQLELEITETVLVTGLAGARRTLDAVRRLGVGFAIDDFGTGYSSLGYLRELPVDVLKIDKSFIARAAVGTEDARLVEGVVALAHGLGLRVVAEGVEGADQLELLRGVGCDEGQGYLFARPAPPSTVLALHPAGSAIRARTPDGPRAANGAISARPRR